MNQKNGNITIVQSQHMTPASSKENLKREIGVRSLVLAIVNITAGSGIFVIPAIIAGGLGATAILAYFVCGLLIFLIGLCFAELGSKTTVSGGVYTYIEKAFGPYPGFLANNIYWIGGCIMSDAAIANALADTLKYFVPALRIDTYRMLFLFLVFSGLAMLNIRSVKNSVRFIEFATLGKLIPMIILVIVAARFVVPSNLAWEITPTVTNIGTASLLLFFAFIGLDGPLSNGGEIKNPKRTVPLGIFFGILLVLVLYISIQLVTQGVLGAAIGQYKEAPLAAVANISLGKTGAILIIVATALSMLGALGGEILSIPRILFAGARDGLLPKPLAKVHPLFSTPYIAIAIYASFGFLLAISGGFKQLATIASAAILIIYLGVVMASIKLRKEKSTATEKTFKVPGGIIVPLFAIAGILWLLSNLKQAELAGMGIFILAFSVIYLFMKFVKKKRVRSKPVETNNAIQ
ncbi:MAG: amino acid permease [Bacteroidota bacterium]